MFIVVSPNAGSSRKVAARAGPPGRRAADRRPSARRRSGDRRVPGDAPGLDRDAQASLRARDEAVSRRLAADEEARASARRDALAASAPSEPRSSPTSEEQARRRRRPRAASDSSATDHRGEAPLRVAGAAREERRRPPGAAAKKGGTVSACVESTTRADRRGARGGSAGPGDTGIDSHVQPRRRAAALRRSRRRAASSPVTDGIATSALEQPRRARRGSQAPRSSAGIIDLRHAKTSFSRLWRVASASWRSRARPRAAAGPPPPDDFILEGGRVADGTGAPLFAADVAVRDGRVVAIGRLAGRAGETPDRRARASSSRPGFIDLLGQSEYNVLVDPRAASKITQGITTEVTGEGDSIAPLDARPHRRGHATPGRSTASSPTGRRSTATSARSSAAARPSTWRRSSARAASARWSSAARTAPATAGRDRDDGGDRRPGDARGRARRLLLAPVHPEHLLVDRGARSPSRRSPRATAAPTSRTSARSPAASTRRSTRSSAIAKEAGVRTQIWHLKTAYKPNFGRMPAVLKRIEEARAAGHRRRREPVPVHARLERSRRVPAAVGPRGRPRGASEAARRSRRSASA